jgi:hypothetical protein
VLNCVKSQPTFTQRRFDLHHFVCISTLFLQKTVGLQNMVYAREKVVNFPRLTTLFCSAAQKTTLPVIVLANAQIPPYTPHNKSNKLCRHGRECIWW